MVTAQEVKNGYGQKIKKPHTSVLPYLRAQEAERKAAEKAEASNKPFPPQNIKSEPEKASKRNDEAGLDQYDEARLEILRG